MKDLKKVLKEKQEIRETLENVALGYIQKGEEIPEKHKRDIYAINAVIEALEELDVEYIKVGIDDKIDIEHFRYNYDMYNMLEVSMNNHLDIDFITEFQSVLDWKSLTLNYTFSKKDLLEFEDRIYWEDAIFTQENCDNQILKLVNKEHIIEHNKDVNNKLFEKYAGRTVAVDPSIIMEANAEILKFAILGRVNIALEMGTQEDIVFLDDNHNQYIIEKDDIKDFGVYFTSMYSKLSSDIKEDNTKHIEYIKDIFNSFKKETV